jgi:hypothetical protein
MQAPEPSECQKQKVNLLRPLYNLFAYILYNLFAFAGAIPNVSNDKPIAQDPKARNNR